MYYTNPCVNGHTCGRYVKNTHCPQCQSKRKEENYEHYRKLWSKNHKENKDRSREREKLRWQNNREKESQRNREYRKANKEKIKERQARWRQDNKQLLAFYASKYRAMRLKATPPWADISSIKQFYLSCPKGYHVDHIVPLRGKIVCGLHTLENLQYLTGPENLEKGNNFQALTIVQKQVS